MDQILQQIPQQLINGVTVGGVYALIAIGYTMVYGILFMLNFAHGEVYMIGGFTGWWVLHLLTNSSGGLLLNGFIVIILMILFAMALTGALGMGIERFAYRPLRNAPRMNLLLSALGVTIVLRNLVLNLQGAKIRFFHTSALIPKSIQVFHIGGTVISFMRLLVIGVSIGLMAILTWFVKETKMGKAMRATAQDTEAATFMGIDVNRIILLTFLIGSALGGAAGALVGLLFTQVDYYVGYVAGLKGFTAAVLGGIGSIPGAMVGGFILGIVESLATTLISSTYKDVVSFIILILVLLIRPWGILGEKAPEKV
ncbi:MAG: branched-chain amino acid ABC transporter permease [Deltaproteobacteria bacterium]|nr:branched-chain amino acid ABC transporter permease [Deltaproteobacteria bacterium]MBW1934358.1 branched-chain amino acid ABC transporter permease [Deltaproteobacteria bacterium]MBW1978464.1 branched-chain amino acid ABC transporter permease [Deltaproteobacteria bacterium]MBW2043458.1 branched-chain amino acid ABC transporter permease [Deltaproteobacteria bacterium]MBW2299422.1 branched-chain amino acid ABC transporter permease [Deltaproteobacteria bacterium]